MIFLVSTCFLVFHVFIGHEVSDFGIVVFYCGIRVVFVLVVVVDVFVTVVVVGGGGVSVYVFFVRFVGVLR